jgi:hypothetical protein
MTLYKKACEELSQAFLLGRLILGRARLGYLSMVLGKHSVEGSNSVAAIFNLGIRNVFAMNIALTIPSEVLIKRTPLIEGCAAVAKVRKRKFKLSMGTIIAPISDSVLLCHVCGSEVGLFFRADQAKFL